MLWHIAMCVGSYQNQLQVIYVVTAEMAKESVLY